MAVDLSGLNTAKQRAQQFTDTAFTESEDEYIRRVQNALLGAPGGKRGVLPQYASAGYGLSQPETTATAARVAADVYADYDATRKQQQLAGTQLLGNLSMLEPQFRLQESQVTGTYGGAPTLAREQFLANKALQEGQLTGQYQGAPTLQAQQLAQQKELTLGEFQLRRDLLATQIQAQERLQGRELDWKTAQNAADRQLQREQLAQQATLTREEFTLRRDLLAQQIQAQERMQGRELDWRAAQNEADRILKKELGWGDIESREKLAEAVLDWEKTKTIGQGGASILNWLIGGPGSGGNSLASALGLATGGASGLASLYKLVTGKAFPGIVPAIKALFGSGGALTTEQLNALDPAMDWESAQAWVDNYMSDLANIGANAPGLALPTDALNAMDAAVDWGSVDQWLADNGFLAGSPSATGAVANLSADSGLVMSDAGQSIAPIEIPSEAPYYPEPTGAIDVIGNAGYALTPDAIAKAAAKQSAGGLAGIAANVAPIAALAGTGLGLYKDITEGPSASTPGTLVGAGTLATGAASGIASGAGAMAGMGSALSAAAPLAVPALLYGLGNMLAPVGPPVEGWQNAMREYQTQGGSQAALAEAVRSILAGQSPTWITDREGNAVYMWGGYTGDPMGSHGILEAYAMLNALATANPYGFPIPAGWDPDANPDVLRMIERWVNKTVTPEDLGDQTRVFNPYQNLWMYWQPSSTDSGLVTGGSWLPDYGFLDTR